METFYIKSIIGEIARGIENKIHQNVISRNHKILLYGLDRYSFAMRTILSNLGYHNIEGYISDDEALAVQYQSEIQNFACRFLKQKTALINVYTFENRLLPFDENALILIASKDYLVKKAKLETYGYRENTHFFQIYNFRDETLACLFEKKTRMTLAEIKRTEKEILAYVDVFCAKHGIRYWVCGGTLLGTIRHKGFIPWDDDIDIFLPWQDYLRLIALFRETEESYYHMIGFGTEEMNKYLDPFAKVVDSRTISIQDVGTLWKVNPLWVDVFPLVGLPEEKDKRRLFFAAYRELNRQIWQEFYSTNGDAGIFSKWFERQSSFIQQYDFDTAAYVGVLGTVYGEKDCTSRNVYDKTLRLPFEDIEVNVPVGYKEYLDNLYGEDWIKLPDEAHRKTNHDMTAYWNREY
ncbi:MAG: LicD family protein [Lachnospiraceae bacterium]|jgi:lipopolysaccharide cholinephosphotransferase